MEYTEIASHGFCINKEVMSNGEQRTRLIFSDGRTYIRTEASKLGAWQNSHYHTALAETYLVQKGWIGFAELIDGSLHLSVEKENNQCSVKPMVPHNVYLPANSIIFTIKHGKSAQGDWHASQVLDDLTKHLSEQQIKKIVEDSFI